MGGVVPSRDEDETAGQRLVSATQPIEGGDLQAQHIPRIHLPLRSPGLRDRTESGQGLHRTVLVHGDPGQEQAGEVGRAGVRQVASHGIGGLARPSALQKETCTEATRSRPTEPAGKGGTGSIERGERLVRRPQPLQRPGMVIARLSNPLEIARRDSSCHVHTRDGGVPLRLAPPDRGGGVPEVTKVQISVPQPHGPNGLTIDPPDGLMDTSEELHLPDADDLLVHRAADDPPRFVEMRERRGQHIRHRGLVQSSAQAGRIGHHALVGVDHQGPRGLAEL